MFGLVSTVVCTARGNYPHPQFADGHRVANKEIYCETWGEMKPELDFSALRFHGRSNELNLLKEVFNRVNGSQGSATPQLVVVEGDAGTGKSALVTNFLEQYNESTLICGNGKFQADETEPFAVIKECLQQIAAKMKKRSLQNLSHAQIRILSVLVPALLCDDSANSNHGDDGSISVSSVATVETPLPNNKFASNRLKFAIRSLIRNASKDGLIVFVLDDTQWADQESLNLLEALLNDKTIFKLMVVAIHRTSAMKAGEDSIPLWMFGISPSRLTRIQISNFTKYDVAAILSQLLRREHDEVRPLAKEVHKKTSGNAFFLLQFLPRLYEQDMIYFSLETYQWVWDLERIHAGTSVADNIADLLSNKIMSLPYDQQMALVYAAVLGMAHFGLDILFKILTGQSGRDSTFSLDPCQLKSILDRAVSQGLLEKLTDEQYKFSHNRVQESLAKLKSQESDRCQLHWDIGINLKELLDSATGDELARMMIDKSRLTLLTAHHLNKGAGINFGATPCFPDDLALAKLNYDAGLLAFQQSSFLKSTEYLQLGFDLLQAADGWHSRYELTLQLSSLLIDVLQITGKLEQCKNLINEVLGHAKSLEHTLRVNRSLSWVLMLAGSYEEAIELCLDVLDSLGIRLPRRFQKFHVVAGMLDIRRRLAKFTDEELLSPIPVECNLMLDYIFEFTEMLGLVSFVFHDMVCNQLALQTLINLTLKYGSQKVLPFSLASSGTIFAIASDYDKANHYANLATRAAELCDDPIESAKGIVMANAFLRHWRKPYHECLKAFSGCVKVFEDVGDLFHFFRSFLFYSMFYYLCGLDLRHLETDMILSLQMLEEFGQTFMCAVYRPMVQFVLNLRGNSEDPRVLTGFAMNEESFFKEWTKDNHPRAFRNATLYRMLLAYFFGDLHGAENARSELSSTLKDGPLPMMVTQFMFEGLISFSLAVRTGKSSHVKAGRKCLNRLKKIYDGGNVNCHHMMMLLQAEAASFSGDVESVKKLYDDAIVAAAKLGFLNTRALGNELAGKYFLRKRDDILASMYFTHAVDLYTEWGAEAKANHLKTNFGDRMNDVMKESNEKRSSGVYAKAQFNHKPLSPKGDSLEMELQANL